MVISLVCGGFTIVIDQYVEQKQRYSPDKALTRKIVLKDLTKLGIRFWLIVGSMLAYYISFLCFLNIATAFATDRFTISDQTAGFLSVSYL